MEVSAPTYFFTFSGMSRKPDMHPRAQSSGLRHFHSHSNSCVSYSGDGSWTVSRSVESRCGQWRGRMPKKPLRIISATKCLIWVTRQTVIRLSLISPLPIAVPASFLTRHGHHSRAPDHHHLSLSVASSILGFTGSRKDYSSLWIIMQPKASTILSEQKAEGLTMRWTPEQHKNCSLCETRTTQETFRFAEAQTRRERRGCHRCVPCAGSLSLGLRPLRTRPCNAHQT
jgi:hypothetical protein